MNKNGKSENYFQDSRLRGKVKSKGFGKYASNLSSVSPRILLSGPAGSEIYQETLSKALAKHFSASLLIVDSLLLSGGTSLTEVHNAKESAKPERTPAVAKRSTQVSTSQHKKSVSKLVSSVDGQIIGGSTFCSPGWVKLETNVGSSKATILKNGDRVKFIGHIHSPSSPQTKGPSHGSRGRILLAFEDNGSSKFGLGSIDQFHMAMILEAFVKAITDTFVPVILFVCLVFLWQVLSFLCYICV
ncbi:uncharacterized protein LOC107485146 [Arachis duranensis]|uniref:Uncharacterized protein LOC107485146 n=1 Tax=Arachis duranensis TaxID=130453 RepID=A0A9C6WI54_ARADU|nr:uncharacterized protein LOC107485146 [Arachis duranensis]